MANTILLPTAQLFQAGLLRTVPHLSILAGALQHVQCAGKVLNMLSLNLSGFTNSGLCLNPLAAAVLT